MKSSSRAAHGGSGGWPSLDVGIGPAGAAFQGSSPDESALLPTRPPEPEAWRASTPTPNRSRPSWGTRGLGSVAAPFAGTGLSLRSRSRSGAMSPLMGAAGAPTAAFGLSEAVAGTAAVSAAASPENARRKTCFDCR